MESYSYVAKVFVIIIIIIILGIKNAVAIRTGIQKADLEFDGEPVGI